MKATIDLHVDKKLKEEAQVIAKSMGITLSELVNSYLIQVAVTRRVDFFTPVMEITKVEEGI